jgi:hypothetical protein
MSKSQVSRICAELDSAVDAFRERRLDHTELPYVFLDDGGGSRQVCVVGGRETQVMPRCSSVALAPMSEPASRRVASTPSVTEPVDTKP